ncbi:hypothetical protein M0804_008091 [Polistes exclamans]|nr:hypothetical protein M0804_008091 [Polistes exclamans]
MSTDDGSSNENSAEPKAIVVTVAEAGQPENPDIVDNSALELTQEDKSSKEKTQDSNHLTKEEEDKPEVTFAPEHTSISYEAEEGSELFNPKYI